MLSNRVGESDSLRIDAPVLLVVTEKNPDDHYQHGRFPADARAHADGKELETELVTVPEADHSLLIEVQGRKGKEFAIHRHAVSEIVQWLRKRLGRILES